MCPVIELPQDELRKIDAYWRACTYLAAGMIYLRANPLLREPLQVEHVKRRLLGHWGSSPGLSFIYIHLNRLINKYNLDTIFLAGPGHGAPGVLAPAYLEGTYSEIGEKALKYKVSPRIMKRVTKAFERFGFGAMVIRHCCRRRCRWCHS